MEEMEMDKPLELIEKKRKRLNDPDQPTSLLKFSNAPRGRTRTLNFNEQKDTTRMTSEERQLFKAQ